MNLYTIDDMKCGGSLIDLRDTKSRLAQFFIWGEGDGRFLQYTTPVGIPQPGISHAVLQKADFLPANIGVPIFSPKAVNVFQQIMPEDMSFHACRIQGEVGEMQFFLARIETFLPLIDEERSSYRELCDGEKIIETPVYKDAGSFFIARDATFHQYFAVSQEFVDLCAEEKLGIEFFKLNSRG